MLITEYENQHQIVSSDLLLVRGSLCVNHCLYPVSFRLNIMTGRLSANAD